MGTGARFDLCQQLFLSLAEALERVVSALLFGVEQLLLEYELLFEGAFALDVFDDSPLCLLGVGGFSLELSTRLDLLGCLGPLCQVRALRSGGWAPLRRRIRAY